MPDAHITAMRAILREIQADLSWFAEQLLEMKRGEFFEVNNQQKNKNNECNKVRRRVSGVQPIRAENALQDRAEWSHLSGG
jgi:hypothetical protein